ncbi:protein GRINL1A [Triplophysa rosa]|nr:protein GRINL1A [Triplophysa rosa]
MAAAWTAPQGQVGDLRSKSKDELLEILSRQQKLLSNKRFVQRLPDKGRMIADFVEKVSLALGHLEEDERKQASLLSARAEFQAKYQQAFSKRSTDLDSTLDTSFQDKKEAGENTNGQKILFDQNGSSASQPQAATETLETACENAPALLMQDTGLVEAFEQFTLAKSNNGSHQDKTNLPPSNTILGSQPMKKPHYIEVMEKTEKSVYSRKARFKPNQITVKSGSSSPSHSSGSTTPLTAEARKLQDRKHLDDITAARLPPLHHSPAQLLSIEESTALLQEQTRKYEELQAKQAAQKLADGLSIRMESYNPEGGPMAAYREVHDDGAIEED